LPSLSALRSVLAETSSRHAAAQQEAIGSLRELALGGDVQVHPHVEVSPAAWDLVSLRPFLRRLTQPWSDP